MKKRNSILGLTILAVMLASMTGCSSTKTSSGDAKNSNKDSSGTSSKSDEVKEFTMFSAVPGNEINSSNVCQDKITELIGAKCKETWLTGQTAEEAVGVMIAGDEDELPDFLNASSGHKLALEADIYIPIDDYWDDYPNIKKFYDEAEWNKIRAEDGHVYIIPQFGNLNGPDMQTIHNDECFWIQERVLEWDNYPKITTLDEYFDLIERYLEANPTMKDGTKNIGYEILCDDWRYFCLENAPMFLDGFPNDGCCLVDPETHKASDYNTTETAKKYFNKLNEEFKKGVVDPETFTIKYDQYISKLSTGRVLGMVDQYWNFQDAELSLKKQKLYEHLYIPVGVVIDKSVKERYRNDPVLDVSNGVGITKGCDDVEGALKFINDLLDPEVLTLRHWGIKDVDYMVKEDGTFYLTEEQRTNSNDQAYRAANRCFYSYFPYYEGMNFDGINAWAAEDQPGEFYDSLSEPIKKCFEAYNVENYVQLLNKAEPSSKWFPMWSFSNAFSTATAHGTVKVKMDEVKHEYLPKVVMAEDFDASWEEYLKEYNKRCDIDVYLKAMDDEIQRRIDVYDGKK